MTSYYIEIGLAVSGVLLLGLDAFATNLHRKTLPWLAVAVTGLALVLLLTGSVGAPGWAQAFYATDSLASFYKTFALVTTLVVLLLAIESDTVLAWFSGTEGTKTRIGEFYALPILICAGMMWMASAKDLVTVFVPLELVTVSFYVLVAYTRRSAAALEAGVKYLILGALSTGVLVFGIAWVYGATGQLSFEGIAKATATVSADNRIALLFGAALVLAGLAFKVGVAPFHVWIPDVYQGAPNPVTAFLSVGSKAAGFVVFTRMVNAFLAQGSVIAPQVQTALLIAAGLTIILGSLPAIFQTSLKRLLGYSSISHAGFMLLGLASGMDGHTGLNASGLTAFYLSTYLPATLLAFLVLCVLRSQGVGDDLKDITGLARRSPGLAFLLVLALASMAGIPLTAGFMGKLLVFLTAVAHGHYCITAMAVIGAAAGFYYYLRPILAIYTAPANVNEAGGKLVLSPTARVLAIALAIAILVIGVQPRLLQTSLSGSNTAAQIAK